MVKAKEEVDVQREVSFHRYVGFLYGEPPPYEFFNVVPGIDLST